MSSSYRSDADEIAALNELIAEQRRMLRSVNASRTARAQAEEANPRSPLRVARSPSPVKPASRPYGAASTTTVRNAGEGSSVASSSTVLVARPNFVASSGWYAAELERLNDDLTIANQRASLSESRARQAELDVQNLRHRVAQMEEQVEQAIRGRAAERDHILDMQHALIEQKTAELMKAHELIDALKAQLAAANYRSRSNSTYSELP